METKFEVRVVRAVDLLQIRADGLRLLRLLAITSSLRLLAIEMTVLRLLSLSKVSGFLSKVCLDESNYHKTDDKSYKLFSSTI